MASAAFDLLAADYDRTWTNSEAGRAQRDAVWRHVLPLFRIGDTVLDLGCGTGEDAERLMRQGVGVLPLDASPEMVRIARGRGVNAEVADIEDLGHIEGSFDGAFSNFGALNCVEDLAPVRTQLARMIRPGRHLAICLMGRFCLRESLHFLKEMQFRKAARRWSGQARAEKLGIRVFYPSAKKMKRDMAPDFRLVRRVGIDDRWNGGWPLLRAMADHQLFIFVRETQ